MFKKKYRKNQANKNAHQKRKKKTKMKNKTFTINVSPSELFICMYSVHCVHSSNIYNSAHFTKRISISLFKRSEQEHCDHIYNIQFIGQNSLRRRMLSHRINVEGQLHTQKKYYGRFHFVRSFYPQFVILKLNASSLLA